MRRTPNQPAFTLIELLVVLSIIALLVAILLPALGAARDSAKAALTRSAMRQTLTAYAAFAVDHKGTLLPGYLPGSINGRPTRASLPTGLTVYGYPAQRYPLRLAEYQGDAWQLVYHHTTPPDLPGPDDPDKLTKSIQLGVSPGFGINAVYVGGDYRAGAFNPHAQVDDPAVYRLAHVRSPARLIAFAETQQHDGVQPPDGTGLHLLQPPRTRQADYWTANTQGITLARPGLIGVPLGRHTVAPITGHLDGHADTIDPTGLNDMQHWSNQPDPQAQARTP